MTEPDRVPEVGVWAASKAQAARKASAHAACAIGLLNILDPSCLLMKSVVLAIQSAGPSPIEAGHWCSSTNWSTRTSPSRASTKLRRAFGIVGDLDCQVQR